MKLLFVVNADPAQLAGGAIALASVRYRAAMPAAGLRALGWDVDVISLDQVLDPAFQFTGDAIVLAQPKEDRLLRGDLLPGLGSFIQRHRAAGVRLLIDVSDLKVGEPYLAHIGRGLRNPAAIALCRQFYPALLRAADLVVVPTAVLGEHIQLHAGSHIRFAAVGDTVEVAAAPVRFAPDAAGPLRLLWFGFFGAHAAALARFCLTDMPRLAALRPLHLTMLCEAPAAAQIPRLHELAKGSGEIAFQPWSVPALEAALAACDAAVFPIDQESEVSVGKSNNRALQALQAGRAIFAHPIASYRELQEYGVIADDLVPGIAAALADPAACVARTAAGQAYVAAQYSPAAIAQRWADVIRS